MRCLLIVAVLSLAAACEDNRKLAPLPPDDAGLGEGGESGQNGQIGESGQGGEGGAG